MHWPSFIFGALVGWIVEWLLDIFCWRRRCRRLQSENDTLRSQLDGKDRRIHVLEQHEEELDTLRARVGEVEAKRPGADLDLTVKAPKAKLPNADLNVGGTAQEPEDELPSLGIGAASAGVAGVLETEAPGVNVNASQDNLPGANLDVDVEAPDADLPDVTLPEVDPEAPAVKLPSADLDVDAKAPKADLPDVALPAVDVEAPEVKLPSADMAAGVRAAGAGLDLELGQSAPSQPDDLRIIEGIGPKIAQILNDNGILTFAQLAATSVERLKAILEHAGPRFRLADPTTWPNQARLAAEGAWDELKALQTELNGGRRTSHRRR
jgi:predicted flap endonuclease-1-like 5' DNA nuclease